MDLGIHADQIKSQNKYFVKELRKESTDLKNRILSIHQDSLFVRKIHDLYPNLPLIPNLRCGAWYTPPSLSKSTAYFKSTDGHTRQWRFSLKRSNLQIIDFIQRENGAILVDSTRRGKSIPDSLSKTVPIWCAVLNQASHLKHDTSSSSSSLGLELKGFESFDSPSRWNQSARGGGGAWLRTPKEVVGESEHEQIASKVDGWVEELMASDLPIPNLQKPLVPIFITPSSNISSSATSTLDSELLSFHPILLLSTSHAISSGHTKSISLFPNSKMPTFTYVQGAGDDHESWSQGLTPTIFWNPENHQVLVDCERDEIESKVKEMVERDSKIRNGTGIWFTPSGNGSIEQENENEVGEGDGNRDAKVAQSEIYLGQRNVNHQFLQGELKNYSLIIHCSSESNSTSNEIQTEENSIVKSIETKEDTRIIRLGIEEGKKGVNKFASALPKLIEIIKSHFKNHQNHEDQSTKKEEGNEKDSKCQDEIKNEPRMRKILICSSDGKDLPGSFSIAILAIFFDENQKLLISKDSTSNSKLLEHRKSLTKASIQRRLEWIITSNPDSLPSRTHLKRINEWLLSPKGGRFG